MRREARVLAVVPVEYYTRPVPLTRPKVWGVESFVGMRVLEVRSHLRPDELFPPGGAFTLAIVRQVEPFSYLANSLFESLD